MTLKRIVRKFENVEGNFWLSGAVYISPENMKKYANNLTKCEDGQELLITPYLMDLGGMGIYELRYYEFLIEFLDVPQAYFLEYLPGNTLPKEITENIKPKAIIPNDNKMVLTDILLDYLTKMDGMVFEEERNAYDVLRSAKLFYQIF